MSKEKYGSALVSVESHGLKLLTSEENFQGTNSKCEFQCQSGHVWTARLSSVLDPRRVSRPSKGCPQCAEDIYIKQSLDIALSKLPIGDKIFSSYIKDLAKPTRTYKIICKNNHKYEKRNADLDSGCPHCTQTTFVGQERVRIMLEAQTGFPFIKSRPSWLVNPDTGRFLELDGYCEELKMAFEFQGRQHYSNKTQYAGDHLNQSKRDRFKVEACAKHGVRLFVIKQPRFYSEEKFFNSVSKNLSEQGFPLSIALKDINFNSINDTNTILNKVEEFKQFVEQKGYKFISTSFSTMEDVLGFSCEQGHTFSMKGSMFKSIYNTPKYRNIACLECHNKTSNYVKTDIDLNMCVEFAQNNQLSCLSSSYTTINTLMDWKCAHGHTFQKTFRQMKRNLTGQYCPHCITAGLSVPKVSNKVKPLTNAQGAMNVTIQTCVDFGLEKKLTCLDTEYKNVNTLMSWTCEQNHTFQKTFRQLQRNKTGQYCPICAKLNPLKLNFSAPEGAEFNRNGSKNITIETCREFALENNLVCLSTEYTNVSTPMDWKCSKGHVFTKYYRQFLRSKTKNHCPHCLTQA